MGLLKYLKREEKIKMTNTKEIDEIIGEMDSFESPSNSEASFDLAPTIQKEIKQLADSLRETNQNLHTYEFMLGQYKKLAKVSPVIQTQNNHPLEEELKRIANSIKSIESREGSITNELYQLKSQMSKKTDTEYNDDTKLNKIAFLEGTIDELKAQLKAKEEKCTTLTEANHRLYHELACEKEKNLTLDKKLDGERKAAQIVSKDVQKYVDFAKNLEIKLEEERRKTQEITLQLKSQENFQMQKISTPDTSIFCKTCLCDENDGETNPLKLVVDKVEKLAEHIEHKNNEIVQEVKKNAKVPKDYYKSSDQRSNTTHTISDDRKASLKMDLAEISAERDSLLIINEKLQKEIKILVHEAEVNDSKHKNLKGKCKTLLNKHRGQSDQKKRLTNKLGAAKKVLINVDQLCRMHEKNHGLLMNYFGGQAEVLGRLLSSLMGSEYTAPVLAIEKHEKLTSWFCSVHSVLVWTQKQLVTLGKHLWIEGLTPSGSPTKSIGKTDFDDHKKKTSNPNAIMDINTLSDISNSLDKDDHVPNDVMKILENQESILQYTRDSVNELREVLATGDS